MVAALLAACGSTTTGGDDGGTDLAGDDLSSITDLASPARDCRTIGCRAFSSSCSTSACTCIPLLADEPDPRCDATMVSCLIDPCEGKTAVCNKTTRRCEIQAR